MMTTYVMSAEDVRAAVSMPEAIDAVREAFISLASGEFEQPNRTVLREGGFLVMPVHHRPSSTAMVKTLSVDFDRVPAITGTVTWSELGRVGSVVADAATVTALRTGAIVGVATELMAHPTADRLTVIGAGGQAADQVRAVHAVRPLKQLTVVDIDPARAAAMLESVGAELPGVDTVVASDAADAVADADIVCCATPSRTPLFPLSTLPARVHVNAIGAFRPTMRELPDELLADAAVVVDELDAVLEESGEILHALASGAIEKRDLTELGNALAEPPELGARTVFKTVGIAVQDWAIARVLAQKCC